MISFVSASRLKAVTGAAIVSGFALLAGSSTAFAVTWKFFTPNPVELTSVKDQKDIFAKVEKETNGDLVVQTFLGGTLQIQPPNLAGAVADGIVQIGDDQQFGGNVPIASLLRLPTLLRSEEEYKKASDILLPYVEDAYKKLGLTVLATYYYPPLVIFSTTPIKSLDDMKGKKIRTLSPESSELIKLIGGTPLTLNAAEQAPALQRGLVDGVTTASSGSGIQLKDIVKYNYRIPIAFSNVYLVANTEALNALKPATRESLLRNVREGVALTSPKIMQNEIDFTKQFIAEGMVVTEATAAEVNKTRELMAPVWEEWAKKQGPTTVEALAKIRAAIGR